MQSPPIARKYGPAAPPSKLTLMGARYMTDPAPDPGAPPAPAPAPPAPAPAPPAPAPAPSPAPPAPAPAAPQPGSKSYDESYVKDLREEAKGHRERAQAAETARQAAAAELEQIRADARESALVAAVARTAAKAGGNDDLLLDSSKFRAALKDVDLKDTAKVQEVIQSFVKDNPAYSLRPQGPGSSGPGRPSGDPGTRTPPASLEAAVASALAGS
jgi:hypothetical protein